MKRLLLILALIPLTAFAQLTGELAVPYTSAYTFRGAKLAGASVQPSVELTLGDFTATVWANKPLASEVDHEIDFSAAYATTVSSLDLTTGITAYSYPNAATTWEPTISLGKTFVGVTSTVAAYYDLTLKNLTTQGSLIYERPFGSFAFVPRLAVGYVNVRDGQSYTYWEGGAELAYAATKNAKAFAGVSYTSSDLKAVERDIVSYSAGLRLSF